MAHRSTVSTSVSCDAMRNDVARREQAAMNAKREMEKQKRREAMALKKQLDEVRLLGSIIHEMYGFLTCTSYLYHAYVVFLESLG